LVVFVAAPALSALLFFLVKKSGIPGEIEPAGLALAVLLLPGGAVGFLAGYIRPRQWLPVGLVAGLPVAVHGLARTFRDAENLWPFEMFFFVVWLGFSVLGARGGERLRASSPPATSGTRR
jgi:hypothetical protein